MTGFGGLEWGAPSAEMKEKHPNAKMKGDGWYFERAKVAGLDAVTFYGFITDKFVRARVVFLEKHVDKHAYLEEHDDVRRALTGKYGRPTQNGRDIWLGDQLYRDKPDEWGMAVATGRLSRWSVWEFPETQIELSTQGENFEITNRVNYWSRKLKSLIDEAKREDSTKGL